MPRSRQNLPLTRATFDLVCAGVHIDCALGCPSADVLAAGVVCYDMKERKRKSKEL